MHVAWNLPLRLVDKLSTCGAFWVLGSCQVTSPLRMLLLSRTHRCVQLIHQLLICPHHTHTQSYTRMHPPDPPIHTVQLICMHSSTQTSRIEIAPLPILLTHKFTVIYTIIPRLPKLYSVMLYGSFWTQLTASKHPQYEEIGGSIDFLCLLYLPSWQRNGGGSQPETSLNYIIPSHPLTTVFPHIIHSLCSSLTRSVCHVSDTDIPPLYTISRH